MLEGKEVELMEEIAGDVVGLCKKIDMTLLNDDPRKTMQIMGAVLGHVVCTSTDPEVGNGTLLQMMNEITASYIWGRHQQQQVGGVYNDMTLVMNLNAPGGQSNKGCSKDKDACPQCGGQLHDICGDLLCERCGYKREG